MTVKRIFPSAIVSLLLMGNTIAYAIENTKTPANANNPSETIYSEDKINIAVQPNHPEFTIQLKSNPTTGYSWFLRECDESLITPVKHVFKKPENQKLMGAPGYEIWTFKAKPAAFVVPHQTTIRFIYARPWQGADSSTQVVFRVSTQGK